MVLALSIRTNLLGSILWDLMCNESSNYPLDIDIAENRPSRSAKPDCVCLNAMLCYGDMRASNLPDCRRLIVDRAKTCTMFSTIHSHDVPEICRMRNITNQKSLTKLRIPRLVSIFETIITENPI